MSRSNQYLKWNEISGNGLTSAVNSAAVATAGLAEANRDIVGLADKFTKLGQDISKTATERRDKALNEYSNNLFNEALQGSMNADGTVNSGQLMQNLKTLRERDKANGEFWNDQEVGNKIGALTLKYNDTFADNAENAKKNRNNEWLEQQRINMAAFNDSLKLDEMVSARLVEQYKNFDATIKNATERNVKIPDNIIKKMNRLGHLTGTLARRDGKAIISSDSSASTNYMQNIAEINKLINEVNTDLIALRLNKEGNK